jgi:hypothetical protein
MSRAPSIDRLWVRVDAELPTASAVPARRRRTAWSSRLAVAMTVGVALAVLVGGVIVLQSHHGPPGPAATANASSLTRILGVLRRPQTVADRTAIQASHAFAQSPTKPITSLARTAATLPGGRPLGLVPVRYHGRVALALLGGGGNPSCCFTPAQIEAGQVFWSNLGALALFVPDGVARVRYQLAHPVTVPVHDNVAVIRATVDGPGHHAMTWLAPDGSVVKQFGKPQRPTPATGPPQSQPGNWRGGRNTCDRAPRERGLPARIGCVSVVDADIDGDGRPDAAILYATLATHRLGNAGYAPRAFWLVVRRASGGELRLRIRPTVSNQFFLQHGNLNGVPGAELIVQTGRISSSTDAVIYTDAGGRLRRERPVLDFSGDSISKGGFTCSTGAHSEVVQHVYEQLGQTSPRRDTRTTYAWRGATLRRVSRTTTTVAHLSARATTLHRSCGTLDVPRPLTR